jgi:hypothetical protein
MSGKTGEQSFFPRWNNRRGSAGSSSDILSMEDDRQDDRWMQLPGSPCAADDAHAARLLRFFSVDNLRRSAKKSLPLFIDVHRSFISGVVFSAVGTIYLTIHPESLNLFSHSSQEASTN